MDGGGWELLAYVANEIEGFSTLAEMSRMADIVAVAQATGVDGVRTVGRGEGALELAQVRFRITRDLSGWDADSVVVELVLPGLTTLEELEAAVPELPPTVIALREKAPDEAGRYRLVNSESLWTEQPDGGVVAPLDHHSGRAFQPRLTEIQGLDDLADHLEAARR